MPLAGEGSRSPTRRDARGRPRRAALHRVRSRAAVGARRQHQRQLSPVRSRPGAGRGGYVQRKLTAGATGWVTARLSGARGGDWDLAIFDAGTAASWPGRPASARTRSRGHRVAAPAPRRAGMPHLGRAPQRAARRRPRRASRPAKPVRLPLVRVASPARAQERAVEPGLDLTEHAGPAFVDVVLHGATTPRKLRKHKFIYTPASATSSRATVKDRAADRPLRAPGRGLRAAQRPRHLPPPQRLRRRHEAARRATTRTSSSRSRCRSRPRRAARSRASRSPPTSTPRDGKPVFLNMGVHHAREWPSGEHAMEWAFELVNGYKSGDPRTRAFVRSTRTIVIPIVNPDGFNTSREAGETAGAGGGRGGPDETPNLTIPYEYQRKNCRVNNTTATTPHRATATSSPPPACSSSGSTPTATTAASGAATAPRRTAAPRPATTRRTTAATGPSPSRRPRTSAGSRRTARSRR